jgi:hypothetical protein
VTTLCPGAIGQNVQTAAKVLDSGQVLARPAAFLCAMQEFTHGDGGDCRAAGLVRNGNLEIPIANKKALTFYFVR